MSRIGDVRISQVVQIRDMSDVLGSLLPTLPIVHTEGAFYVAFYISMVVTHQHVETC